MTVSKKYEADLDKIWNALDRALLARTPEECRIEIFSAQKRVERLKKVIASAASEQGRKGGLATAERGPEYFKRIAAMRKTRGGGRPKKSDV